MYVYSKDGALYHYGVKGMKWGVRRTAEQLGYKTNKKVRRLAEKYADAQKELVTHRALKAARARGDSRVTDDMLSLTNSRAYYGMKYTTKYIRKLKKKYVVDLEPKYESNGRQYLTATLTDKRGNTYVHEIYSGVKERGGYLDPENYT